MRTRLIETFARINEDHPWSHNNAYAPFVLHHARRARRAGAVRGLDIGCGTGALVRRLARILPEIIGLEVDADTARKAMASTMDLPNVKVVRAAFPLDKGSRFDFVSMVAVLHHLPLEQGVRAARDVVSPAGRLVIVGCYRDQPRSPHWLELVSLVMNPLIGVVLRPRRASGRPPSMTAPVATPIDSYAEIRAALHSALPGVKVRRGPFWRYTAVWVAPPHRVYQQGSAVVL